MYSDYFYISQPDYKEEIFDFYPESQISFSFQRNYQSFNYIDDYKYISSLSNIPFSSFSFSIENLSEVEKDEILDFYVDENKSNGIQNSFLFKHPIYNEYFICKFSDNLKDSLKRHGRYSYDISLDVLGVDTNLIPSDISEYISYEIDDAYVEDIALMLHEFVHVTLDDTMGSTLWV